MNNDKCTQPCICETCLQARDAEIARVRASTFTFPPQEAGSATAGEHKGAVHITIGQEEPWVAEFVEEGAALEHERWAKWQEYLHSKCVEHSDGKGEWVCFPSESFKHWERQIATPYEELTEREKESDRKEVRKYLPLIQKTLEADRKERAGVVVERVEAMKLNERNGKEATYKGDYFMITTWEEKMSYNAALEEVKIIIKDVMK